MKFSIKDRLNFPTLYPQTGNILTQILVKSISEKVTLTPEEIEEIDLKSDGQLLRWDETKAQEKEIEFTEAEINLLRERVSEMDNNKQINQDILPLCLLIKQPS